MIHFSFVSWSWPEFYRVGIDFYGFFLLFFCWTWTWMGGDQSTFLLVPSKPSRPMISPIKEATRKKPTNQPRGVSIDPGGGWKSSKKKERKKTETVKTRMKLIKHRRERTRYRKARRKGQKSNLAHRMIEMFEDTFYDVTIMLTHGTTFRRVNFNVEAFISSRRISRFPLAGTWNEKQGRLHNDDVTVNPNQDVSKNQIHQHRT